jgi:putative DNA primase/helicase
VSALSDAAVELAGETSWKLFPCVGKVPATPHGFHDATADGDELISLFDARPDADGFALACGLSGIAALDCDVTDGLDGRDALRDAGVPWQDSETIRATTPRGGEHALFAGVLASRTGALPGVDIKSTGGYIVLPPARDRAWQACASPWDLRPAPVPAWLSRLAASRGEAGPRKWEDAIAGYVGIGARNVTASSIAGHLLHHRVEPKLAALLVVAWGRAFCDPPLEDREALAVFRSIAKRENL